MKNMADIITAFGGPSAFGRFFDVSRFTVSTWKRRNYFPAERDLELIEEARRRKIKLDYSDLARMRAGEAA